MKQKLLLTGESLLKSNLLLKANDSFQWLLKKYANLIIGHCSGYN